MSRRRISEAETRKELIDPQLEKVGWFLRDKTKVGTEIPVDGYDAEPWNGVSDYILLREECSAEPARRVCGRGGSGRRSAGAHVRGGEAGGDVV